MCFGDNIFICVDGRERGSIFFRYHDRPKRYIKLADSFRTFVQKCKVKSWGIAAQSKNASKAVSTLGSRWKFFQSK